MPKKYKCINQKAAAALARKAAVEEQKLAREQQELEELLWREDDKHVLRKQQRKELREQKRQQTLEKKAENRVLLARETASLKGRRAAKPKVTRADIEVIKLKSDPVPQVESVPLQENINRNGSRMDVELQARSVIEAIAVLKVGPEVQTDKNPEKRVRSTFKSYEQTRLGKLRRENPGLRLSQVKQLVAKEWEKCRLNPMNRIDVY